MATTIGTVTSIRVDNAFCCVTIQPQGAALATFVLWGLVFLNQVDDSDRRFLNSYWLSLARDAFANGKKLSIDTDTGSSIANVVTLIP